MSKTMNYDVLRQLDEAPQLKGYVQEVVHSSKANTKCAYVSVYEVDDIKLSHSAEL